MIEIKKKTVKSATEKHDKIKKKIHQIIGYNIPLELISVHGNLQSVKVDDTGISSSKKTALKNYLNEL